MNTNGGKKQFKERRTYLTGNTFPVREEIKAAGGRWDPQRKLWYVSPDKRPIMLALAKRNKAKTFREKRDPNARPDEETLVRGEAILMADREPYWIAWMGRAKAGMHAGALRAMLITRDGRKSFWAAGKEFNVTRRFETPAPLAEVLNQLANA